MKSFFALCVFVLIFGIVLEKSEAKIICRCTDNKLLSGASTTSKATYSCGEVGKYYCHPHLAKPYCEVGSNKDSFDDCCINYGEGIEGAICEDIV